MNFNHRETWMGRNALFLKTDDKLEIEILFDGHDGDAWIVSIDDTEIGSTSDTLLGVYVQIGGHYASLASIVRAAERDYPEIMRENRADARIEDQYVSERRRRL